MAKKLAAGEMSKQEIVMEFLKTHVDLTAKEVQEALANKGTEVSIPTIHAAKQKAGLVKARGGAPASAPASKQMDFPPASAPVASNGPPQVRSIPLLIGKAADFVKECGGNVALAKQVLEALERVDFSK